MEILGDGAGLERVQAGTAGHFSGHRQKLSRSVFSGPIAALLRERILSGALPAGTKLAETKLADELSVSRGPVRNALQVLESEGLVRTQPNGRVVVVGFSDEDVDDLLDTRYVLEVAAAERAIRRSADFGPLREALRVMEQEGASTPRLVDLDIAFHLALLEASGSRFLSHAWLASASVVHASITITNQRLVRQELDGFEQLLDKHRAILESLEAHDLEAVSRTLREHFGFSGALFPRSAAPGS